jgi:hypothetical protein
VIERTRNFAFVCVLALGLLGCAVQPQAETPRQGIAACYASVKTAYATGADLRARGKLSETQRIESLKRIDAALAACDAARVALASGDFATVDGKLAIAEALLLQLEALLPKE